MLEGGEVVKRFGGKCEGGGWRKVEMCRGVLRQVGVRIGVGVASRAGLDGDMCELAWGQGGGMGGGGRGDVVEGEWKGAGGIAEDWVPSFLPFRVRAALQQSFAMTSDVVGLSSWGVNLLTAAFSTWLNGLIRYCGEAGK